MGALSRALVVACVGALGCAGARTQVVAPASRVPVSMSRAVRDAHGDVVPAERRKVVAKFHDERSAWAIFYSAIPFNPTTDISDEVNAQVSRTGGDAVTHLAVTARPCALNYFVFPFGVLPIWPGCVDLEVDGDIVKVQP